MFFYNMLWNKNKFTSLSPDFSTTMPHNACKHSTPHHNVQTCCEMFSRQYWNTNGDDATHIWNEIIKFWMYGFFCPPIGFPIPNTLPTETLMVDFRIQPLNSRKGGLRGVGLYMQKDNMLNEEYLEAKPSGCETHFNISVYILVDFFVHCSGLRGLKRSQRG